MMRGKPKDIDQFIGGGKADIVDPAPAPKLVPRHAGPVRKKLVELPDAIVEEIKDRARAESKRTGMRVTETSIIIDALSSYLGL